MKPAIRMELVGQSHIHTINIHNVNGDVSNHKISERCYHPTSYHMNVKVFLGRDFTHKWGAKSTKPLKAHPYLSPSHLRHQA